MFFLANEFPVSFESIVRKIVRLLFHVVAHLYAAHFREVVLLGLHAHLNLTFAHLTALQHRFSLIEPKETEVLRDLELALRLSEDNTSNNTSESSQGGSSLTTELATEATLMELESSVLHHITTNQPPLSTHDVITSAPPRICNEPELTTHA